MIKYFMYMTDENTNINTENINHNASSSEEQALDYKLLYEKALQDLSNQKLLELANQENMRKSHKKDMQDMLKYANEKILTGLMPILDTFDIALQYAKDENAAKPIGMLKNQFVQVLTKFDVKMIQVNIGDNFDANFHEAVETVENDEMKNNQIAKIEQAGYMLNDRVLRATRVTVVQNNENN